MILSEQEKNRILNIHQTSKNVNGVLITEQSELETIYYVRVVGIVVNAALKAGNTKTRGDYDFGTGNNLWWKASHPDKDTDNYIKDWNVKYPERPKHIRISNGKAQKEFYWEMGPFSSKDKAITAQEEWEDYTWEDAKLFKRCGNKGENLRNYKTIPMDQECGGEKKNVATETDTENLKFPNLELSDSLTLNQMPTFDPTKEGIVYKCDKKFGCAAYVRQELGEYQGNAWHAHRHNDPLVYSAFLTGMGKKKNEIEQLFNKINKSPGTLTSKQDSFDNEARNIAKSFVPNQSRFSSLEIDDVVGLYYDKSDMHSSAFFEGMTGYDNNGAGTKLGDGPFMVKKDGTEWRPKDLGQNLEFKIGKTLTGGKGPGLNTHLGYVGAKNNGEPIIFHNVYGNVYATPLKELSKDGTAIVWAKRGKGTSGQKVVANQKYDEVEQATVGYFDWLYKKYIGN